MVILSLAVKCGKIIEIEFFQRAVAKQEVNQHIMFFTNYFLQSYKPKNQVKNKSLILEIAGSSEVYILKEEVLNVV